MIRKSNKFGFTSLGEMVDIIQYRAETVDQRSVYTSGSDGVLFEIPKKLALVGGKTDTVYGIPSDKYELGQHEEVAIAAATMMQDNFAGLRVEGFVELSEPRMDISMKFPDYVIDDGTSSRGIEVGAFIQHSIDGKSGLVGGAKFYRVICTNGMMLQSSIPEANFSVKHLGGFYQKMNVAVKKLTESIEIRERIARLVESAIAEKYVYFTREDLVHTLHGILGSKRLATEIVEKAELNPYAFTRYDLYKDVTKVLEHGDTPMMASTKYSSAAEMILQGAPIIQAEV